MAYSTTVGEVRRYRLPDGTMMTLDTDSRVETLIEPSRREVKVVAGGAFFEVDPHSTASFLVTDAEFRVQAAAASFFISTAPEHRVFVTSGHVDLGRVSQGNNDAYRLERGKLASLGRDGTTRVSKFSDDLIARNLAWREGGISLDGETVLEAAQLFNRYNRRQISVADVGLANEEIVGWFDIDQPETFAQAVASAFNGAVLDRENLLQIVPRKK
ncbi:FecR family protein [Govanella unica]|uniref:FecR domain-containing protein n=1 Tax=Govanella unica TaxID=2975056 RepID=A0A9X3U0H3_9PROT|nr:FecR domain-containing protein [Govania unica]MDA5194997.1 FecR domain-containing protein [Govania unica]